MESGVSHFRNGSIDWADGVTIDAKAQFKVDNSQITMSWCEYLLHKTILDRFIKSPLDFETISQHLDIFQGIFVKSGGQLAVSILKSPKGDAIGYMVRFSGVLIDLEKLPRDERLVLSATTVNDLPINNFIVGTEILAVDGHRFSLAGEEFFILNKQLNMVIRPDGYIPRPFSFEANYLSVGDASVKLVWPSQ